MDRNYVKTKGKMLKFQKKVKPVTILLKMGYFVNVHISKKVRYQHCGPIRSLRCMQPIIRGLGKKRKIFETRIVWSIKGL